MLNTEELRLRKHSCVLQYKDGINRDSTPFGPDYMHNKTLTRILFGPLSPKDESRDAWKYTSADADGDFPFDGEISSYNGGGFGTELAVDRETAAGILDEMKNNLWIDRQTRAILLEYITYNGNSNLFSFVTLWIEIPVTGGFLLGVDTTGIRFYATGLFGIYMRVMEVTFVILLVVNMQYGDA